MKNDGMTFIYISHRMEEIHEIGDGGTILRDGKHVKTLEDVKNVDMNTIVKYLVGREITQQYPERNVEKVMWHLKFRISLCRDSSKISVFR